MTFVATAPAAPSEDLPNHPFWPKINPDDFRELMRVDGTVTAPRVKHALIEATAYINGQLRDWRWIQETKGILRLTDVPDEEPGRLEHLYRRAIYEWASADLIQRYLRYDATGDAQQRAEPQQLAVDDHRQNSFWAVRDILGLPRSTVELI
jgi:hypothetical protein